MRKKLFDVLNDKSPAHNQRLWFAGFLKSVGYKAGEIILMIDENNRWQGYDPEVTAYQVKSLFGSFSCGVNKEAVVSLSRPVLKYSIPPDLDAENKEFFEDALGVAYEYTQGKFNRNGPMKWMPEKYPIYRTIEGRNHHLFVIDIDGEDLDECYRVSQEIKVMMKWDWYKFSGNKGYHLIQKRKGRPDYESMKADAELIAKLVGVTFQYKCGSQPNIDPRMYHRNQLIRGFCVNLKTGIFSE